jgi:uroporphyrinogen-III synthase
MELEKIPIINPEELNEDFKNFSQDQINDLKKRRAEQALLFQSKNGVEYFDATCNNYEMVIINFLCNLFFKVFFRYL